MQHYLLGSGCVETSPTQETHRTRVGRIRNPIEQATSKHLLQEERQGRNQLHRNGTENS